MIPIMEFGKTGHQSTRTIFGAAALANVTQDEADKTFELLQAFGINHIDAARSYGEAEVRIGPWMKHHREEFFLATKTNKRTKQEALDELQQSLERLQTDYIDLWQLHFLVDEPEKNIALSEDGAIDAAVEAKQQGLVRYIGVTGHGIDAPGAHLSSLKRFEFDSVLFPYNYLMMKQKKYAEDVEKLLSVCAEKRIAVQTIKAIAKRNSRGDNPYATWYEPLEDENAISPAVQWVLHNPQVFLNTASDIHLLPKILKAASQLKASPSEQQMEELVKKYEMEPLFS